MIRRPINPLNLPVDPMGSPRSPTLTLGPPGRPSWALTPLDPLAYLYCLTNHQRTVRHFAYSCHFIYGLRSFFCIFPLCHFTFIFGHWSILCILWFCNSMSSSLFVTSFSYSVVGLFFASFGFVILYILFSLCHFIFIFGRWSIPSESKSPSQGTWGAGGEPLRLLPDELLPSMLILVKEIKKTSQKC